MADNIEETSEEYSSPKKEISAFEFGELPSRSEIRKDSNSGGNFDFDAERQKNENRAQRFGVPFKAPQSGSLDKLSGIKRYRNPKGGFTTGLDLTTEDEKTRQNARAARFGVVTPDPVPEPKKEEKEEEDKDDMEVDKIQAVEPMKEAPTDAERRYDALYVYGVDKLSTDNIFEYFEEYGPTFVEWINDSSCNVVFADTFGTRRALDGMTQATSSHIVESNYGFLIRPAHHYKSQPMFMRYATTLDVKPDKPNRSQRLWLPENRNKKIATDPDVAHQNEKVLTNKVKKLDKSALTAFLSKKDNNKRRKKEHNEATEVVTTAAEALPTEASEEQKEEDVEIDVV